MVKDCDHNKPDSFNNVRLKFIVIFIVCSAAFLGIFVGGYNGVIPAIAASLQLIAIGCFFLMPIALMFSPLMESITDTLIYQIPKHRSFWNWFCLISLLSFLCFTLVIVFYVFASDPESAISIIKNYWLLLLISLFVFIFSLSFTLISNIFDLKLSSVLKQHISSEMIENSPQAAIEHSFTVFEDHLRKKLGATPGDSAYDLINQAFAKKQRLIYSTVKNEQQGMRDLMSGANAVFRNPRKHQIIEDEKKDCKNDHFID